MKILITGGAGLLGIHVVRLLLKISNTTYSIWTLTYAGNLEYYRY
jgi:dTDP-D-glucose 4,6-dehydratase